MELTPNAQNPDQTKLTLYRAVITSTENHYLLKLLHLVVNHKKLIMILLAILVGYRLLKRKKPPRFRKYNIGSAMRN